MAEVQQLARERERLDEERIRVASERQRVMEQLAKESRGLYLRIIAPQILQAHDDCSAEYERVRELETTQRLKQSIAEFLVELASDEACVCGRPLEDHSRAMIREAASSANPLTPEDPADNGEAATAVASRLELLRRAKTTAERAAQRFEELAIKKVDLDERLSGVESSIATLDNQMGSIDAESVNELRTLIAKADDEISLTERERLALELQIESKKEAADQLERQIRRLGGVTGVGAALEAQIDLLDRTERAFEEFLVRSARARRAQIEEQANHFFKQITIKTTGYESMFISDDFTFGINASDGTKPNMDQISEGEKHVVAFSFIMGLNRYAKSSAPLIIDTPMGRLEQEHRRNLAAAIASLDQQVFLFVTDTDLAFGVREILGEAVEKEFEIVHDQSTLTSTIREMSA
jgi:DNA sulfur modification protein DndD